MYIFTVPAKIKKSVTRTRCGVPIGSDSRGCTVLFFFLFLLLIIRRSDCNRLQTADRVDTENSYYVLVANVVRPFRSGAKFFPFGGDVFPPPLVGSIVFRENEININLSPV